MKVIFLDVDGVLNSHDYFMSDRFDNKNINYPHNHVDPKAVNLFNKIFDQVNAKIVLSSTWRILESKRKVIEQECGIKGEFIGVTDIKHEYNRGYEIQKWIDEHTPDKYVILDDDRDMLLHQFRFLIKINNTNGLQKYHIPKIVKILNG